MNTYIGMDLGTSGLKLLLVAADGTILAENTQTTPSFIPNCTRCTAVSGGARFWTASWSCSKTDSPTSTHYRSAV